MNDKERILMCIITRVIPKLLYKNSIIDMEDVVSLSLDNTKLQHGDLVYAFTTIMPNEFMVGFVEEVKDEYCVIREIGSDRLCNYSNESFVKINKDILGYEILEGTQYKIYKKVLKAFEYVSYSKRFKSISFDGNICTVEIRMMFSNDLLYTISFPYNSKTTIASIGKLLKEKENSKNV